MNLNPLKRFYDKQEHKSVIGSPALCPRDLVNLIPSRAAASKLPFDRHAIFRVMMGIPNEWEEAFWIASVANSLWCLVAWTHSRLGAEIARTASATIHDRLHKEPNDLDIAVLTMYKAMLMAGNIGILDELPLSRQFIERIGPVNIELAYAALYAVSATQGLFCSNSIEMLASYLQAHTRCSMGAFDVIADQIALTFQCSLLSREPRGDVSLIKPETV